MRTAWVCVTNKKKLFFELCGKTMKKFNGDLNNIYTGFFLITYSGKAGKIEKDKTMTKKLCNEFN